MVTRYNNWPKRPAPMPTIFLKKPLDAVVITINNQGGYTEGRCFACDKIGDTTDAPYGVPCGSKHRGLEHKDGCPVNTFLMPDGTIKSWRIGNQKTGRRT